MPAAAKLDVTMPPELLRVVQASVDAGEFASTSEAIRDAVRVWQRAREARAAHLAAVREQVNAAFDDPRPSVPADDVFGRLERKCQAVADASGRGE